MKQMSRDPLAASKARKAERRADEKSGAITIKPLSLASADSKRNSGFKRGGFKNAFGNVDDEKRDEKEVKVEVRVEGVKEEGREVEGEVESGSEEGEGGERYDPRRPTGCGEGCRGRM